MNIMRGSTGARIGAGSLLAVGLLAHGAQAAHAQNPQDILKKMVAVYQAAKSFQGTVTTQITGKDPKGKPVNVTQTQSIRFKSPNKLRIESSATATGELAAQIKKAGKQTAVSDGKTAIVYSGGANQYIKVPAQPQQSLVGLMRLQLPPTVPGASMDAATTIAGRPAYVVKIKPQLPPNISKLPAEQRKMVEQQFKQAKPVRIMIDKQNFHLLRTVQSAGAITSTTNYGIHTVNGAIADSAFAFTIPAGAKEVKPPTPQGGGGVQPGNLPK
jgi:outer membrane lipoprotein-sorting protein